MSYELSSMNFIASTSCVYLEDHTEYDKCNNAHNSVDLSDDRQK